MKGRVSTVTGAYKTFTYSHYKSCTQHWQQNEVRYTQMPSGQADYSYDKYGDGHCEVVCNREIDDLLHYS